MSPEQLTLWITAASIEIARGRSADELALLGSIFNQLGATLTTMSAQMAMPVPSVPSPGQ